MNLKKLTTLIDDSGIKKSKLSKDLGISDSSLRNKLSGKTDFTIKEMTTLAMSLHLSPSACTDVFFSDWVAQ